MTWMEEAKAYYREAWRKMTAEIVAGAVNKVSEYKEEPTMKVSYNGFTGLLWRLELVDGSYELEIFDKEKEVTYSFVDINIEKLKFVGGKVIFGGGTVPFDG